MTGGATVHARCGLGRSVVIASAMAALAAATAACSGQLPQEHAYQRQLREFMAELPAEDMQAAHRDLTVVPWTGDADERFRTWLLSLQPPSVGAKRNYSSVMLKAE